MKKSQVDLKQRTITLQQTKTGHSRSVPLTATAALALKPALRKVGDFVFKTGKQKEYLPQQFFRRAFTNAVIRAGLGGFHLHDLRHTAASHLLQAGVDLRTLAEILGHRTMQMVMRYTHVFDRKKQKAIDKLNRLGL